MYHREVCWCCGSGDGRRVIPSRTNGCGIHPLCAECRRSLGTVAVERLRTNVGMAPGTGYRFLTAAEQRETIAREACRYTR